MKDVKFSKFSNAGGSHGGGGGAPHGGGGGGSHPAPHAPATPHPHVPHLPPNTPHGSHAVRRFNHSNYRGWRRVPFGGGYWGGYAFPYWGVWTNFDYPVYLLDANLVATSFMINSGDEFLILGVQPFNGKYYYQVQVNGNQYFMPYSTSVLYNPDKNYASTQVYHGFSNAAGDANVGTAADSTIETIIPYSGAVLETFKHKGLLYILDQQRTDGYAVKPGVTYSFPFYVTPVPGATGELVPTGGGNILALIHPTKTVVTSGDSSMFFTNDGHSINLMGDNAAKYMILPQKVKEVPNSAPVVNAPKPVVPLTWVPGETGFPVVTVVGGIVLGIAGYFLGEKMKVGKPAGAVIGLVVGGVGGFLVDKFIIEPANGNITQGTPGAPPPIAPVATK